MTHDQLQVSCHLFIWNNYPELRYLSHGNLNNLTSQIKGKAGAIKMSQLKSMGLVKGVLDYEFYYQGVLHVFDFKVGKDKLSKEQKEYIAMIEKHGGKGYEIRSLDEFIEIIERIVG